MREELQLDARREIIFPSLLAIVPELAVIRPENVEFGWLLFVAARYQSISLRESSGDGLQDSSNVLIHF